MKIVQLVIDGFRGVAKATIDFADHTVLVGPNGCGKTTIVDALALIFGRDRIVRTLTEHDFSGSDPKPSQRIRLIATVAGFRGDEPDSNENWFRDGRAVPKWWSAGTRTLQPQKTSATDLLCAQIGFAARFDQESLSVEIVRYFHDDDGIGDPFDEEAVTLVPGRLLSEIGFFVVPSTRTWERIASFESEIFRRIIKDLEGLPAEEILRERDRLRSPEVPLETIGELRDIVSRINAEFARIVPGQPEFQFRVTSTDADSLLRALVPHYRFATINVSLPANRHGTGLLSLQTLILLLEFGRARRAKGKSFILAIEEPEVHLPPPLQRRSIYRAQAAADQTICTSHSPHVASYYTPEGIRVLENREGKLKCQPLLSEPLRADAEASVRKLYLDNRFHLVEALMHSHVLVPEGRIDFEWLRLLSACTETAESVVDAPEEIPFGAVVGVIPTHNASVKRTFERLSTLRSDITVLVDGDKQGADYTKDLLKCIPKPDCIVQWPLDWAIEEVVAWILEGDEASTLAKLNQYLQQSVADRNELLQRLKTDTKSGGLKSDYLAYQEIAGAIRDSKTCMERVRRVLGALRDAAVNRIDANRNLEKESSNDSRVVRWKP